MCAEANGNVCVFLSMMARDVHGKKHFGILIKQILSQSFDAGFHQRFGT